MTLKDWAARQRATTIIDFMPVEENAQRKRGPKGKRTPETEALLYDALCQGVSIKIACGYSAVSEDFYYDWVRADPGFAERMSRARAASVVHDFAMMRAAAPRDWRAAEAHIRMVDPAQYGRNGGSGPDINITTSVLVQSPEFTRVMRTILDVLVEYPEARFAVSDALQRIGSAPQTEGTDA
jgi:hypothetical protein